MASERDIVERLREANFPLHRDAAATIDLLREALNLLVRADYARVMALRGRRADEEAWMRERGRCLAEAGRIPEVKALVDRYLAMAATDTAGIELVKAQPHAP